MSRSFNGTNTFHLDTATSSISAPPITMFAWAKFTALGTARQILNIGTSASASNRMSINLVAANGARFSDQDSTNHDVISGNVVTDTTGWHMLTGRAVDHGFSGRSAELDAYLPGRSGGGGGASTPTAPNCMRISGDPAGGNNMNGLLAHVGFYSVTLTDAEIVQLYQRGPFSVQRANLVEYWPMTGNLSPEPSYGSGATPMVLTGAVAFSTDNPFVTDFTSRFITVMP